MAKKRKGKPFKIKMDMNVRTSFKVDKYDIMKALVFITTYGTYILQM